MRDQYSSPWLLLVWPIVIGGLDWAVDAHPIGASFLWLMLLVVFLICVHAAVIGSRVDSVPTDKIIPIGAVAGLVGSIFLLHGAMILLDVAIVAIATAVLAGLAHVIGKSTRRRRT